MEVFPDYYGIEFRRDRQDIRLGYSMLSGVLNGVCPLGEIAEDSRCIYKTIKLDTYCQQKEVSLLRT
ncbi:MAG: hypothetical protein LBO09_01195 [Candidatus Peribacteria bacterium]|nr:hypothetical protein [Candidatus Peribacteria bacterium]